MDQARARAILSMLVMTPESQIQSPSDIMHVGPYSSDEVKQAQRVTAREIVGPDIFTTKTTPHGEMWLYLLDDSPSVASLDMELWQDSQRLLLGTSSTLVSSNAVPNPILLETTGFTDNRRNPPINVNVNSVRNLTDLQLIWLGLRWTAANMLNWNTKKGYVSPEELDITFLPD